MASRKGLDPHRKPPEIIRSTYKNYEKLKLKEIDTDADIVDFVRGFNQEQQGKISKIGAVAGYTSHPLSLIRSQKHIQYQPSEDGLVSVYEHDGLPGESSVTSGSGCLF